MLAPARHAPAAILLIAVSAHGIPRPVDATNLHAQPEAEGLADHTVLAAIARADADSKVREGDHRLALFVALGAGEAATAIDRESQQPPVPAVGTEETIAQIDQPDKARITAVAGPDGLHVVWRAKRRGKWVVLVDGKEGPELDDVQSPVLSPDGRRVAYHGKLAGADVIIVDGKKEPGPGPGGGATRGSDLTPIFSADSRRIAYVSSGVFSQKLVIDGQPTPKLGLIFWRGADIVYSLPVFSPDGQHVAYAFEHKGKCHVVFDSETKGVFLGCHILRTTGLGAEFVLFSPNSQRLAYASARKVGKTIKAFAIVDGTEGPAFAKLATPFFSSDIAPATFSPDSTHIAYSAEVDKNKWAVVVDSEPGPAFDSVTGPAFSADSQHVAYLAGEGQKIVEVMDHRSVREFESEERFVGMRPPQKPGGGGLAGLLGSHISAALRKGVALGQHLTFAPDSRTLAYVLVKGGGEFVEGNSNHARRRVVSGSVEGPEFDSISLDQLRFSRDSRHLAYEVHDIKDGKSLVVLDGAEGHKYDEVICGSLHFISEDAVAYVARREGTLLKVTQTARLYRVPSGYSP